MKLVCDIACTVEVSYEVNDQNLSEDSKVFVKVYVGQLQSTLGTKHPNL